MGNSLSSSDLITRKRRKQKRKVKMNKRRKGNNTFKNWCYAWASLHMYHVNLGQFGSHHSDRNIEGIGRFFAIVEWWREHVICKFGSLQSSNHICSIFMHMIPVTVGRTNIIHCNTPTYVSRKLGTHLPSCVSTCIASYFIPHSGQYAVHSAH